MITHPHFAIWIVGVIAVVCLGVLGAFFQRRRRARMFSTYPVFGQSQFASPPIHPGTHYPQHPLGRTTVPTAAYSHAQADGHYP